MGPALMETECVISVADLVDMSSLRQFRRQRADMPEHLKVAIGRVAGGYIANNRILGDAAKALDVTIQKKYDTVAATKQAGQLGGSNLRWVFR